MCLCVCVCATRVSRSLELCVMTVMAVEKKVSFTSSGASAFNVAPMGIRSNRVNGDNIHISHFIGRSWPIFICNYWKLQTRNISIDKNRTLMTFRKKLRITQWDFYHFFLCTKSTKWHKWTQQPNTHKKKIQFQNNWSKLSCLPPSASTSLRLNLNLWCFKRQGGNSLRLLCNSLQNFWVECVIS